MFKSCDGTTSREVVAKNLYPDSENAVDRLDAVLAEMEELKLVETARVMDPSRRAFLKKAAHWVDMPSGFIDFLKDRWELRSRAAVLGQVGAVAAWGLQSEVRRARERFQNWRGKNRARV